ncbi:MAG: sulfite reductase flavoprotein subunit alpha [Pseudomonadota bacterium]
MNAPYIPSEAPFSEDQRAWLKGFMAGVKAQASLGLMAGASSQAQVQAAPLDILFGTQTGNAEEVANEAAALARTRGFQPRVNDLDAIEMPQLAEMENLIVVVSTYGEGEMPDNAQLFWEALSAGTAPRLENLNYGVLALGDTSYEHFCQAGKLLDTRLEQLGARRLAARVDCDIDFEEVATAWLENAVPTGGGAALAEVAPVAKKSGWTRKNPYVSTMLDNHVLSGPKSAKEIRHIAFALPDEGMSYEAGDALGVMPVNAPDLVEAWLERLKASPDTAIEGRDAPLGDLLSTGLEIMTPSRELIRGLEPLLRDDEFTHVVTNGDKEALEAFLWGKDTLDLLNMKPDLELDPSQIVSWLKPLQHRAYSISSSPKAHPGEVHLTVAAVRWMYQDRPHRGVCSTFLADHVPEGASAGIFMQANKAFRVPEDDTLPMLMVGPGTGIAPFRAFLEERRERGATGMNWLFFGDQTRESDFIYQDEIGEMSTSGLLTRLDLAFSRDQAEKIYVQHRMIENGKALYAALEEGGYFFVCGDATRMAKDVDAALHKVVADQGGLSEDAAIEYVNALKKHKRYVRDVY